MMTKTIKDKWLAALRSGEYQQTRGGLRDNVGYCCLGVLCDLHAKEAGKDWIAPVYGRYYKYGEQEAYLPYTVMEWAGFNCMVSCNPQIQHGKDTSLSSLNDRGIPFTEIADVIEKQL